MNPDLDYAHRLIAKGIELYVDSKGKLRTWPKGSYRECLDNDDRAYFQSHRAELTALVAERLQPRLPDEPPTQPAKPTVPPCSYCNRPCVGPADRWYRLLHWNDPAEVERRRADRARRESFDRGTWSLHEML
jgi:hypothetical protein